MNTNETKGKNNKILSSLPNLMLISDIRRCVCLFVSKVVGFHKIPAENKKHL